ncbi:PH domain-containing protein [Nocardioides sp. YIM 152315]|uniref:PH domain-containing protein n=1 Tax=Nocardioides sp. YIM 152315 TaxID=3031760 RepID=UPI0023DB9DC8|nr:PH domain-containing protein [Nocardioides sp. YIM 152315]MDF1603797.1 PH domain-containing protein [Nocardioides sp. YIM 152315]
MGLGGWTDPDIAKHLLRDEGEVIVDEVRHHWCAYVRPALEALAAAGLLAISAVAPVDVAWAPILLALAALLHAAWLALREHRDRFVITNMRVFRVHGVLSQSLATMPLTRILDITVRRPLHGRLLGFGHFCFESAAQEQGVRDVRYVGRPYERDLAIQRVVQRSGLRGNRVN